MRRFSIDRQYENTPQTKDGSSPPKHVSFSIRVNDIPPASDAARRQKNF
jgi:hypothetical protein